MTSKKVLTAAYVVYCKALHCKGIVQLQGACCLDAVVVVVVVMEVSGGGSEGSTSARAEWRAEEGTGEEVHGPADVSAFGFLA